MLLSQPLSSFTLSNDTMMWEPALMVPGHVLRRALMVMCFVGAWNGVGFSGSRPRSVAFGSDLATYDAEVHFRANERIDYFPTTKNSNSKKPSASHEALCA